MTSDQDLDGRLETFLASGPDRLPDASFDAVRDHIDHTRQRAVIGPWRVTVDMNKLVTYGLGAAAVIAVLFIGVQLLGPPAQVGAGAAPSAGPSAGPAPGPVGGTVEFELDLAPTTTQVQAVADGTSVTGTAVTSSARGTHTVELECAARDGDTWALAGTIEATSIAGERPGHRSAVIVKDGSPQRIGIWLSDPKLDGVDCQGWLAAITLSDIDPENLTDVTSGTLVPPPALAP